MNLSPVQFYSYFITFRGHEPKVVDRGDVHALFVDEPWPSITVLVLWTFWLSCSAFQFFGHLRKNVGLALGCHGCSVAQSCPALCDPMNCSTPVFPSPVSSVQFRSVQSLSHIWLSATLWIAAHQASLSITNSWSLPKLMSIESVMPSSHLMLCHPLLLLPSIPPRIRVFSNESVLCIKWPKYWSFSFSISPSNEHPGLISFRMDWLDLFVVQGPLKRLLQHHSSKASIFQCSAFFTVQLSHPYMTTGKTIALTRRTFVGKVMSLLFNMLSGLVITFLPRSVF